MLALATLCFITFIAISRLKKEAMFFKRVNKLQSQKACKVGHIFPRPVHIHS